MFLVSGRRVHLQVIEQPIQTLFFPDSFSVEVSDLMPNSGIRYLHRQAATSGW